MATRELEQRVAGERRLALPQQVQRRRRGVQVGARRRALAIPQLGRDELRRAGDLRRARGVGIDRDPEVADERLARAGEEQVRRLDVAVHDAGDVHRGEAVEHVDRDAHEHRDRDRAIRRAVDGEQLVEIDAVDVALDDVRHAAFDAGVEHRHDLRRHDARGEVRLGERIAVQDAEQLDHDRRAQRDVTREVCGAHRAGAERRPDAQAAEHVARDEVDASPHRFGSVVDRVADGRPRAAARIGADDRGLVEGDVIADATHRASVASTSASGSRSRPPRPRAARRRPACRGARTRPARRPDRRRRRTP